MFVKVPFYWAISRDRDATFWVTPYTKGSLKVAAEYRQVFSKRESLYMYGSYLNKAGGKKNKWKFEGNVFKVLPYDVELKGEANIVSTSKYRKEFSGSFSSYTERHNDSYAIAVKRFENMRLSVLARYQDDVEENYEEEVYKFPQIDWELYPTKLWSWPLYIEGKTQFLRYRNKNDTLGFDYKVSRFDFYPKISLPINPVPWFSILPKYGIRYTVWSKRLGKDGGEKRSSTDRFIYSFETDARGPLLYKNFELFGKKVRHDIIPEIKYVYIPDETKAQTDIIQFDEVDRILPENKVTYSLTNRFFSLTDSRELLYIKLEQSYDIYRDRKGLPYKFSDIMFELNARPSANMDFKYRMYYSVYGYGVTRWNFSGRLQKRIKGFLPSIGITYYYEKFTKNRYIEYTPRIKYKNVELSVTARRDIARDYWVERSWRLAIHGKCWSIVVGYLNRDNRLSDSKNDKMITFFFVLRGLGKFGVGK